MKGSGIPAAPGPLGPNPRVGLDAFARVVVDVAPARVVARVVERLEELATLEELAAHDTRSSADARHEAEIRARSYRRAAQSLERATAEASA